jgi:hypothetical protein
MPSAQIDVWGKNEYMLFIRLQLSKKTRLQYDIV